MQSYIVMYHSYKDTYYLDKIVSHFDNMTAKLTDLDGDGFLGWQSTDYSVEKINNGSFDTSGTASNHPASNWFYWQSTPSTAYRETRNEMVNGSTVNNSVMVVKTSDDSNNGWQVVEQPFEYIPGKVYQLSFKGRSNGQVGGRVSIYDATAQQSLAQVTFEQSADDFIATGNTKWVYKSVRFKAPEVANNNLKVTLSQQDYTVANSLIEYDHIRIKHVAEYLVHDGMILDAIADFILAVKQNPGLSQYQAKANEYQALIENHFIKKWDNTWNSGCNTASFNNKTIPVPVPDCTVYVFENDDLSTSPYYKEGSSLPHNQYLHFAKLLFTMGKVTSRHDYFNRAYTLALTFKSKLTDVPETGGYKWNYSDVITQQDDNYNRGSILAVETASYASLDVEVALAFAKTLSVFDNTDVIKFTNTLNNTMWNSGTSTLPACDNAPHIGANVSTDACNSNQYEQVTGWIPLAQIDANIWHNTNTLYANREPSDSSWYRVKTLANLADWNPERLVNRDFELTSSQDSTLPARWQRWQSTALTAYRSTDANDRYQGEAGLVIKTNPQGGWQMVQQDFTYTPGAEYRVSFYAKTNGIIPGMVTIYDATSGQQLTSKTFTNTDWQQHEFTFTAPVASDHALKINLFHSQWNISNGISYFDSVEIERIQ